MFRFSTIAAGLTVLALVATIRPQDRMSHKPLPENPSYCCVASGPGQGQLVTAMGHNL